MKSVMSKYVVFLFVLFASVFHVDAKRQSNFIAVKGQDLITLNGEKYFIKGTNLGNWLNPEGYMFLFKKVSSYRLIDQALKELVGADNTNRFWHQFQENYIKKEDIEFISKTGMNTLRIPFHYKLFTCEDYMGANNPDRGFELLDRVIKWCKEYNIHVILDMHDAPGGQTGDNIDDSYGYPWLFENEANQQLYCSIWKRIAKHYSNEETVLGYDLLNEPIAPYFTNLQEINSKLELVYKRVTVEIRKVDTNHIVMLGGAQWNGNFSVFSDWKFDAKMMYTCHRYWCDPTEEKIKDFLDFREKVNLPLYMGETGENTNEWIKTFRIMLGNNNIGWTFWTYKRMDSDRCMVTFNRPERWDKIMEYSEKNRNSFDDIRANKVESHEVLTALNELLENIKFSNCKINKEHIDALMD